MIYPTKPERTKLMRKNIIKKALSIALASTFVVSSLNVNIIEADAQSIDDRTAYIIYSDNLPFIETISEKSDELAAPILEKNNILLADLTAEQAEEIIANGYQVEKDTELTASSEEAFNEDDYTQSLNQWNLDAINLPEVTVPSVERIKIALLDSGVEFTEDIHIEQRQCFVTEDQYVSPLWDDATGHGTALAGLIGAKKIRKV